MDMNQLQPTNMTVHIEAFLPNQLNLGQTLRALEQLQRKFYRKRRPSIVSGYSLYGENTIINIKKNNNKREITMKSKQYNEETIGDQMFAGQRHCLHFALFAYIKQ